MRNLKQMTAIGLSILSIAQCFSPVFAEVNTISNAGSLSSEVTYSKDSYFTVTVPKTIELGSNKEASYTISVTGDVCGDESVTVTPDSSVTLQDANGKSSVTATVTQGKTKFTASDINGTEAANKQTTGKIIASDLTSGNWSGILNFTINKKVGLEPGLYDDNDILLCSWEDSGIDVETDYDRNTYKTATTSSYYVLKNTYPTATKVVIPDSVTSIGERAFASCLNLTNITIPDSVTNIGASAFNSCLSLTSITIPNSVTSIGFGAFSDCSILTSITIPDSVTSIGTHAFADCSSLTSITIPNSVTSIGNYTFRNCSNLTSITIPNSVTSIGNYAFSDCESLTSVTIGNGVTNIGIAAFSNCSILTSITIPNSVTSIGNNAFYECSSLTSATFKTTSGWYVGDSAGVKTTAISSSDLANTLTAATYLTSTYCGKNWTR